MDEGSVGTVKNAEQDYEAKKCCGANLEATVRLFYIYLPAFSKSAADAPYCMGIIPGGFNLIFRRFFRLPFLPETDRILPAHEGIIN